MIAPEVRWNCCYIIVVRQKNKQNKTKKQVNATHHGSPLQWHPILAYVNIHRKSPHRWHAICGAQTAVAHNLAIFWQYFNPKCLRTQCFWQHVGAKCFCTQCFGIILENIGFAYVRKYLTSFNSTDCLLKIIEIHVFDYVRKDLAGFQLDRLLTSDSGKYYWCLCNYIRIWQVSTLPIAYLRFSKLSCLLRLGGWVDSRLTD